MNFTIKRPKIERNQRIPEVQRPKGHFIHGDRAHSIIEAKVIDNGILCLLQWKPRYDDIRPEPSFLLSTEVRKYDPDLLIDFYESKVKAKIDRNLPFLKGCEGNYMNYDGKDDVILAYRE